jgi:hypothetical protein
LAEEEGEPVQVGAEGGGEGDHVRPCGHPQWSAGRG